MGTSGSDQYAATSEVRFAVVLYGGVSLAIYMNGIVQELLQLVRATAPSPDDDGSLWWADGDLSGAGLVYRKLGRLLDRGLVGDGDGVGPVRTRFVVDIITGTSAGGINGVFLAKALAMDRDISKLSDLWVNEGDIDKLLNDDRAADDVRPLKPQRPPLSLLSGQRMLYLLLKALDGVSRAKPRADVADPDHSPYASQIDLWITATDLQGRPVSVATWSPERLGDIREADHRTTFHFRYDATSALLDADDASAAVVNTLAREYDPMLAFAARCTSSFPAAFQAVQLDDLTDVITGVGAIAAAADGQQSGPDWATPSTGRLDSFFADYGGAGAAALHSFADGGYLNNQPVDLVMDTLPKRRADLPVARRVLLVDPDPGGGPQRTSRAVDPDNPPPPEVELNGDRVDLTGTLMKVVSLPRVQTIGGDVEKILALREPCRVRAAVYAALDQELAAGTDAPSSSSGPASAAYDALRRAITARELGEAIARVGFPDRGYPAGSQHHAIATRLVSAWQALAQQEGIAAGQPDTFLASLDLGFELRRINFLQGRIGRDMKSMAPDHDFLQQREMRRALDKAYVEVATRARALRYRSPKPTDVQAAVRAELGAVEATVDLSAPPQQVNDALTSRLQPGRPLRKAMDDLMATFDDGLALEQSRRESRAAVASDPTLRSLWDSFAVYDEAMLPLRDLLPGENDDIEVLRVSPRDTWRLVDDSKQGPKLAGSQVHHFGGFFSAEWRRNDILWGRLDAAERLISALWPASADGDGTDEDRERQRLASDEQRDALIGEAHAAIVADVLQDDAYRSLLGRLVEGGLPARPVPASPIPAAEVDKVLTAIRENYRPPPPPPPQTNVIMAARAARVADGVGKGLPMAPGPLRQVRVWAGRGVQLGAGLVEMALANRARSIVGRHLLDVAVVAAVLMIVLGGLVGGPGVTSFGWIVLLTTIGVRLAVALLASWLAYGRWKLGVALAAIVIVALVVYGLASWSGWPRAAAMLGIGLAVGLVLASVPALLRRRASTKAKQKTTKPSEPPKPAPGRPIAAIALAVVVLAAIAGAAIGHGHNELSDRVCRMDDSWYRTVATRVAVVSCPPDAPNLAN